MRFLLDLPRSRNGDDSRRDTERIDWLASACSGRRCAPPLKRAVMGTETWVDA